MTIIERYDDMNEYDYVDVVEIVNSSISKTNNNILLTPELSHTMVMVTQQKDRNVTRLSISSASSSGGGLS